LTSLHTVNNGLNPVVDVTSGFKIKIQSHEQNEPKDKAHYNRHYPAG